MNEWANERNPPKLSAGVAALLRARVVSAMSVLLLYAVLPTLAQIGGGGHGIWRYSTAALADKVERVPNQPNVSFAQYAGFVSVSDDPNVRRDIFYWFVESERSPVCAARTRTLIFAAAAAC